MCWRTQNVFAVTIVVCQRDFDLYAAALALDIKSANRAAWTCRDSNASRFGDATSEAKLGGFPVRSSVQCDFQLLSERQLARRCDKYQSCRRSYRKWWVRVKRDFVPVCGFAGIF